MSYLTKSQRGVIEEVIEHVKKGPAISNIGIELTADEVNRQVRVWAQTWIKDPLQAVLDNDAGIMDAHDLRTYYSIRHGRAA